MLEEILQTLRAELRDGLAMATTLVDSRLGRHIHGAIAIGRIEHTAPSLASSADVESKSPTEL